MTQSILLVDDDPALLAGIQRSLRKTFQLSFASSGAEAIETIKQQGPFAVIVSDMQMPGMNGADFLNRAKSISPQSIRIMLTGNADQKTAIDAVNHGHIFRFLNKPCSVEILSDTLVAGLEQYRLVTAETELLQKTLTGSINLLVEALARADSATHGNTMRLREYAREIGTALQLEHLWPLEIAALISQIGLISVPAEIRARANAKENLSQSERQILERVPELGHDMLLKIPRLERVAKIVLYQAKHYDGTGFPADGVKGDDIPIESRIILALHDYIEYQKQGSVSQGDMRLLFARHHWYDPNVLDEISKRLVETPVAHQAPSEPVGPRSILERQVAQRSRLDELDADNVTVEQVEAHANAERQAIQRAVERAKTGQSGEKKRGIPVYLAGLRAGDKLVTGLWASDGTQLLMDSITLTEDICTRIREIAASHKIAQPIYVERSHAQAA